MTRTKASALTVYPLNRKDFDHLASVMSGLYEKTPERMTQLAECNQNDAYAVARLASPLNEQVTSPSLVLKRSGKTWRILTGATANKELERAQAAFAHGEPGVLGNTADASVADKVARTVQLPDADRRDIPTVLDLASGQLFDAPVEDAQAVIEHFDKLGKGDLAWDRVLVTLHGARVNEWTDGVWKLLGPKRTQGGYAYYRPFALPNDLLITTAEGGKYLVNVSAASDQGAVIHYYRNDVAAPPRKLPNKHNAHLDRPRDRSPADPVERVKMNTRQAVDLSILRSYVAAILIYQADTGSLPPDLDMLVRKRVIREHKPVENHATGKKEAPLYFGGPKHRVTDFDTSAYIVLAAPSPDRDGKRLVAFLDGSARMIDEAAFQTQLERQRKPLMERTVDAFLETCAKNGIADDRQPFDELGIRHDDLDLRQRRKETSHNAKADSIGCDWDHTHCCCSSCSIRNSA